VESIPIWGALFIPVLATLFTIINYHRKLVWWEASIGIIICVGLIAIGKHAGISSLISDQEYWGSYVTEVEYYEDWNEYIHQTCTESYPCGTDANGNTTYCTRIYDCSYVDYHPENWVATDAGGNSYSIDEVLYNKLVKQFGNSNFIDLGRNYYTNDGDKYISIWTGTYDTYEFVATKHRYKNRVQAASSVYNFPKVDTTDIINFKLYQYPKINYWHKLPAVMSFNGYKYDKKSIDKSFDWLNGKLGSKKEIRIWILLFKNATRDVGYLQESLWKRGNKNEFTITISIDDENKVQWCHPFSWSEDAKLLIDTRTFIEESDSLDLELVADFLYPNVEKNWVRKQFEEFNYLTVEPPVWSKIMTYILTLIVSIVVSIWIVNNEL